MAVRLTDKINSGSEEFGSLSPGVEKAMPQVVSSSLTDDCEISCVAPLHAISDLATRDEHLAYCEESADSDSDAAEYEEGTPRRLTLLERCKLIAATAEETQDNAIKLDELLADIKEDRNFTSAECDQINDVNTKVFYNIGYVVRQLERLLRKVEHRKDEKRLKQKIGYRNAKLNEFSNKKDYVKISTLEEEKNVLEEENYKLKEEIKKLKHIENKNYKLKEEIKKLKLSIENKTKVPENNLPENIKSPENNNIRVPEKIINLPDDVINLPEDENILKEELVSSSVESNRPSQSKIPEKIISKDETFSPQNVEVMIEKFTSMYDFIIHGLRNLHKKEDLKKEDKKEDLKREEEKNEGNIIKKNSSYAEVAKEKKKVIKATVKDEKKTIKEKDIYIKPVKKNQTLVIHKDDTHKFRSEYKNIVKTLEHAKVSSVKTSKNGHLIIEVPENEDIKNVKSGIEAVLGHTIGHIKRDRFVIELREVDSLVSKENIAQDLANASGVDINDIKVILLRETRDRGLFSIVELPMSLLDWVVKTEKIKLGLTWVNMTPGPKVTSCHRCYRIGHRSQYCLEKKERCKRCGQEDHLWSDCKKDLKCLLCADKKLPYVHMIGTMGCPEYRRTLKDLKDRFTNYYLHELEKN